MTEDAPVSAPPPKGPPSEAEPVVPASDAVEVRVPTEESPKADAGTAVETGDSPYPAPADEARITADRPVANGESRFRLGKGLSFESDDGDFSMVPRLRAQFLQTFEVPDQGSATQGFMIRRARLQFTGNVWGKNNKYKAELAVSPRDVSTGPNGPGTSILLDWYLDFTHLRDLSLRVGQYKVPFNRQRVISSGDLQLVDRSIVNARFNVDRDLGFDLRSKDLFGLGMLRYYLGVFVGEGRNTFASSDFGLMYLARLEFLPLGGFKDYKEADLERNRTPKLSIGLGAGYLDRAKRERGILGAVPADGGTTDFGLFNADLVFKYLGLSAFSELVVRNGKRTPGNATVEDDDGNPLPVPPTGVANGLGFMTQAGYLIPTTNLEVAARGGFVEPLGDESTLASETELGGGLSYYFAHHAMKVQLDYFRLTEGSGDAQAEDHRIRIQLQAAY